MKPTLLVASLTSAVVATMSISSDAAAQSGGYFRTAVLFESYEFDPGLGIDRVRQLTAPIGFAVPIGRQASLALSGGYTVVQLTPTDPEEDDNVVHGPLDTEVRLSIEVVPGRLILLFTGAAPTGKKTVATEDLAVLGALSSEVIGFAAPSLGTGGNVGGGFVAAVPVGTWALGFGATFKRPFEYAPIQDVPDQLRPGSEFRIRTGLEGAIARRTYLRVAGIFARRAKDQFAGATQNGVGNRITGYAALNQGIGNASLTVYGFDVFRSDPQIEQTALGAAVLPRGNLLATGALVDIPVGPSTTITPKIEARYSSQAPNATTTALQKTGQSVRYGAKVQQRVGNSFAIVLDGGLLTGNVRRMGTPFDMHGFRAGLHVEVRP